MDQFDEMLGKMDNYVKTWELKEPFSLNWSTGAIKSQSQNVWLLGLCLCVPQQKNPYLGGLETSGQRVYH